MFKRSIVALALAGASLSVQAAASFVNGIAIPEYRPLLFSADGMEIPFPIAPPVTTIFSSYV